MFNREKLSARADAASADPSPASIAAEVSKGAALQLTEREIAGLRERHQETREKLTALVAGRSDLTGHATDRAITKLEADRLEIENSIIAARRKLAPLRAAYAERVTAALREHMAAAAARQLSAITELRASSALMLEEIELILRAGGDAPLFRLPLPQLGELEMIARRYAK